jgi:hypothetical protein
MKDLGAAKKILGMEITRDRKSGLLFLSQHGYIQKVFRHFNMHDSKPVSTLIAPHFKFEGPKKATRGGVNGSQSKFLTELGLCPEINPKPIF